MVHVIGVVMWCVYLVMWLVTVFVLKKNKNLNEPANQTAYLKGIWDGQNKFYIDIKYPSHRPEKAIN